MLASEAQWAESHSSSASLRSPDRSRGSPTICTGGPRSRPRQPCPATRPRRHGPRGDGWQSKEALTDPASHDKWILANVVTVDSPHDSGPADLVAAILTTMPQQAAKYRVVFRSGDHAVYERIATAS